MRTVVSSPLQAATQLPARRSIADLLAPLDDLVANSPSLLAKSAGRFESRGQFYDLPRYLFIGPRGGDEHRRLLDALDDDTLRSIALWKMEGWTGQEIAGKLGITRRSIERKVERIRELWKGELNIVCLNW